MASATASIRPTACSSIPKSVLTEHGYDLLGAFLDRTLQ